MLLWQVGIRIYWFRAETMSPQIYAYQFFVMQSRAVSLLDPLHAGGENAMEEDNGISRSVDGIVNGMITREDRGHILMISQVVIRLETP
jgi:hypothetical protein